ncbi:MAG: ribosome hibernation-promoting factor, HPF/YfiA family [Thermoanaerobaculia bacterium]
MNIDYVARHFSLDDSVRDYAERKLAKALKYLEEPIEIRLILGENKHRRTAEIHAAHRFGSLQATEETADMRDAINLAVDKIEKQARRSRQKAKGKKRRLRKNSVEQWPMEILAPETVGRGGSPKIVESTQVSIKPMNLEEAAFALESSDNQFVVFRDAESDRVNVLYRRRDDNYGLITPEF